MATSPVTPTTSNTHIRDDFNGGNSSASDAFGGLLEPGLRKIFFETYAEVPEQYSRVFKVNTSSKAQERDYGMGAFGDWSARSSEVDAVTYSKLSEGDERLYTHRAFTKGFMISRELYDDEQYRQIQKFPKAMARSGRAFVEKNAATVLINAFDKTDAAIYDGEALCSDEHPLVDNADVEGCNIIEGALSADTLKEALRCMRETVDEAGNLIGSNARLLVVPPALEFTAKEILHSSLLPDTELNNTNSVKDRLEIFVYDYIGEAMGGSDTAWFVIDPTLCELNFFWRVKPEFKWAEDFDSLVAKYRGYMRFSFGVSDWRGIVGSEGVDTP